MYAQPSFKTKKALKEAVKEGRKISIFVPGGLAPTPQEGDHSIEGPNYVPHTWYARVRIHEGVIQKVLS